MERPRARRTVRRLVAIVVGAPALLLLVVVVLGYAVVQIPDLNASSTAQTTIISYRDGQELARVGTQNRISVPLAAVPVPVRHAVLAAENRDYYSEPGISVTGIVRALWVTARGREVQGGSTITQQYVKNAYLTSERTLSRKINEIFIALKLSRQKTKDQVFQAYLNTIYFGRGASGIQTAAETYFGKDVRVLSLSEGALLAALIRAPASYDPATHPEAARTRWRYVLDGMVEKGWLGPERVAALRFPPVRGRATGNRLGGARGYLVQAVKEELARRGITEEELSMRGYRVRTTFDAWVQAAADAAVHETLPADAPKDLQAALVAVQPGTGEVVAMYGGPDYPTHTFNNALQGRAQAGSSFKPYVLAAALDEGIGLFSRYSGHSPQEFRGAKEVENFGGRSYGMVTLLTATENSINTAYVGLGLEVGVDKVREAAIRAGLPADADLPDNASMFLGSGALHPIDQASGFATFAAGGVRADPHVVREVRDRANRVLYTADPHAVQAFDSAVAADVTYALRQVVEDGTGTRARLLRPAAGKTGTSSRNLSAWFVGYVPQLSTAVTLWRGDGTVPMQGVAGYDEITGGSLPARVWRRFMTAALDGVPVVRFPDPEWVGNTRNPARRFTDVGPLPSSPSPESSPGESAGPSASPDGSAPAEISGSTQAPGSPAPTRSPAAAPAGRGVVLPTPP
ncbi:MAG TPA: transglycosylase domain-containing protein [Mycobacteriales bacterium]|nr:transglycosylase domain-containing protein [Mycobacteriales bacterium]